MPIIYTHHARQRMSTADRNVADSVRFCYYDRAGRFQRSPLILGEDEVKGLRQRLATEAPRLQALLRRLVE